MKDFGWRLIAEALSWDIVHTLGELVKGFLREGARYFAFWEVSPEPTVEVFIGAFLPR